MQMIDTKGISKRFLKQELMLFVGMSLIILVIMRVWFLDELLTPLIVSLVFSMAIGLTDALTWRYVAKNHEESLPTFYTAVSGGRLFLALTVMLVYYIVNGSDSMLVFFLVFMAFYLIALAHHAIFFAHVSNHS